MIRRNPIYVDPVMELLTPVVDGLLKDEADRLAKVLEDLLIRNHALGGHLNAFIHAGEIFHILPRRHFRGERTLKETDLEAMIVSYSGDSACDYEPALAPWDLLHRMTQAPGIHWCNHQFENGQRSDENTVPGFNLVVFDFDGGVPLEMVHTGCASALARSPRRWMPSAPNAGPRA